MCAATVVAALGAAGAALWRQGHPPALVVVAIFFAFSVASENLALKFPKRVAVSPQVLLVMAAVVALGHHGEVLGAMVVAAGGGMVIKAVRARRWSLIGFNAAQMALSAGAAALVYETAFGAGLPAPVAYPLTAAANLAVNVAIVVAGASLRSGTRPGAILAEMRSGLVSSFVFSVIGLLVGRLYVVAGPLLVVAAVAPVAVARTVFVSISRLRQAYQRLDAVYGFARHVEKVRDEPDAAASLLGELRRLLLVDTAEVIVVDPSGWRRTTLSGEAVMPSTREGSGTPAEMAAVAAGPVLIVDDGSDDPLVAELRGRQMLPAVAAALPGDDEAIGAVVLAQPSDDRRFGDDDLKLLVTLANHAASSLENSRLLGRLIHQSNHDRLTGLPNRDRFNELVTDLPHPSAILLVDLDHFKEINDTLGHAHGDLLLQRVAERMTAELGRRGIVARLGGDEFAVLLPQTGAGDASQDAVALLQALEQPFAIEDLQLEITASIGVSVASSAADDPGRLLQQADVAMYSAKASHSGWEMYSSDRDHHSRRRLALAGELRRAIEANQLVVHYQPKALLCSGLVVGVEALVRWDHPQWGMLGPDSFIPIAEHAGLIRPLTLHVLSAAAAQHRALRRLGHELEVAVNLSVRSVLDVNLPDQVAAVLSRYGMPAGALTLEITEGSVMADPGRTIGVLRRLADLGASISVDDFGTGYSSLSYLKRLPASEVKIDKSFVAGMLTNTSDAAIVRSTVDLARNLGLRAVAEGVETAPVWEALAALGCEQAQGYYLSPPMPADQLPDWLVGYDRHRLGAAN